MTLPTTTAGSAWTMMRSASVARGVLFLPVIWTCSTYVPAWICTVSPACTAVIAAWIVPWQGLCPLRAEAPLRGRGRCVERFMALVPKGEDRDRVAELAARARSKQPPR